MLTREEIIGEVESVTTILEMLMSKLQGLNGDRQDIFYKVLADLHTARNEINQDLEAYKKS